MSAITFTTSSAESGAGIDVTSVVNQILDAERAPEKLWQEQKDTLTLQATAWNGISASLTGLSDKVNALKDALGVITARTASSSQPNVLTATAQNSAQVGSHVVIVDNLATTSSYYTDPVDNTIPLGNGVITLQVGGGTAVDIPVNDASQTTTLDGLVRYINGHDLGVFANVIQDANGSRLALVSKTTGLPGDLTISSSVIGLNFHKIAGRNASLTVDGIPISSASNTVTGVIPGITLNLASALSGTEVQVNVGRDLEAITKAVSDFADAYNSAIKAINGQFTFNPATKSSGVLASNSTLRSLQASLLSGISYAMSGNNGITGLASIGVNMADDGTLSVDNSKLSWVLNNRYSEFQNLFQSLDADNNGLACHFSVDLRALTDSTTGMIGLDLKQINNTQQMLTREIQDLEDRLAVRERLLTKQYSDIDAALRQYPLLMQQITGQLASLPQFNQK